MTEPIAIERSTLAAIRLIVANVEQRKLGLPALQVVIEQVDLALNGYCITTGPLGTHRVLDTDENTHFIGTLEDCQAWINDPDSRPQDKPADYPFR